MCSKCYHEFIQNEKDTQTSKSISGAFSTTESSINPILDELNLIKPSTVRADAVSLKRKLDSDIAESRKFKLGGFLLLYRPTKIFLTI